MAESMKGLKRSHRCTEVSNENIGETVTLMGWVQKRRNLGSLIFVDLRDRSGLIQLYFDEETIGEEGFKKAASLRAEFVIAVTGTVEKRSGAVNENLETGDIEVKVDSIRILSESETPPFPIDADITVKDELRLKYRFLDLRRPDIQRTLMMRSQVTTLTRQFMANEGFLEIETPMLTKSTPEGARDYLVPSRIHPGNFYALPQSPQLFKQLLMCSGYDRYIQIARCFRDEDLRADRQPEFTQIDMELSFVDVDDVIDVNERFLAYLFKEVLDVDVKLPIQRIIEFLTEFKFQNMPDAARKEATLRYIKYLSTKKQGALEYAYIIQMAYRGIPRERAFDIDTFRINNLHSGRSMSGSTVYPGDANIKFEDSICIQIHHVKLKCNSTQWAGRTAYTLAIYYPEEFAINYVETEE